MYIRIVQYLRPDGRRLRLDLEILDKYQQQYELLCSCGCKITCEQLMDGTAVQYISHALGDFTIEITPPFDKEAADATLLRMIESFDKKRFDEWLSVQEQEARNGDKN